MQSSSDWRAFFSSCEQALARGEEIADAYEFSSPPVDVFKILAAEKRLIHPKGGDFRDAFDGRIRYVGPRFLLCYNTKYNLWPHKGLFHTKVLFTIAHELGHFFLDHHRRSLLSNKQPHGSFVEFSSHTLVESEADHFACGLLMPRQLLSERVNAANFPDIETILDVRKSFDVSLTGLLARWTLLSDFPCATIATSGGRIQFGWVSAAFRDRHCYRVLKNQISECRYFQTFLQSNRSVGKYQQGEGTGSTDYWLDWDGSAFDTQEFYFAIPHTNQIWVHIICDENDLVDDRFD